MLTDEHEHAMKVWWEALSACDGPYHHDPDVHQELIDQAAAAVIAADRAGLVARIAELESEVEVLADNGCHLDALCKQQEAEIERLRDGLAGAIAAISDPRGLDDAICCSGHMCGCRGSSHRELLLHDLSEVLARTALGASHDADA